MEKLKRKRKSSSKLKQRFKNVACPICGELPKMHTLYDAGDRRPGRRPAEWNQYKVSCPNHHLDCGDWKDSKLKAWKEWLKRRVDTSQPDYCFQDNAFAIKQMDLEELADFLFRWNKNPKNILHMELEKGSLTTDIIKDWLEKPVDGIYPKGYPNVPSILTSNEEDIYKYRVKQAEYKL